MSVMCKLGFHSWKRMTVRMSLGPPLKYRYCKNCPRMDEMFLTDAGKIVWIKGSSKKEGKNE